MGKTVLASKLAEWKGLDRIAGVVHGMGYIWRPLEKDDYGIDGEIEVVLPKPDGKGSETVGGIVKVQSKSGKSYIVQDDGETFAVKVEASDLKYWDTCTFPVLFVIYHPGDDRLYYREVKSYLKESDSAFSKPYKIRFDKSQHVFGPESKDMVCRQAKISPPRISFDIKERLLSNLLLVKRLPEFVYRAPTQHKTWHDLKDATEGFVAPGGVRASRLCSLSDLASEDCNIGKWAFGPVERIPADEWLEDDDQRNDFVFMLNQLLRKHLSKLGVRYRPEFRRFYFPREDDQKQSFERPWTSVRTNRSNVRTVAQFYEYGKDKFWRHLAASISFVELGGSWFLQITPKYFFTIDGKVPCSPELAGPYTTSQKANEHNLQVMNHVLFWSDILSGGSNGITMKLDRKPLVRVKRFPLDGVTAFGIPDDPATYEEKSPPKQSSLFYEFDSEDEEAPDDDWD